MIGASIHIFYIFSLLPNLTDLSNGYVWIFMLYFCFVNIMIAYLSVDDYLILVSLVLWL